MNALSRTLILTIVAVVLFPSSMQARDLVGFHQTWHVHPDEDVTDVVCAFCTVTLDGPIQGDLVTAFSDVTVAPGVTIGRDAVSAFTDLKLQDKSEIEHDLVYFGGNQEFASTAQIGNDRVGISQEPAMFLVLIPFLILAAMIYGLALLIRRLVRGPEPRYPYPPPPNLPR